MKSSVEPEDAAIETPAVADTLTEEPESIETPSSLVEVGLGKSVHEQVGSVQRPKAHDPQGDANKRRASVAEDLARRTGSAGKD
jgi:hypothetical protein